MHFTLNECGLCVEQVCATPVPMPSANPVRFFPPRYVWHCAACIDCVSMVRCEGGLQWCWGKWLRVDVLKQAITRKAAWHELVREGQKGIALPIPSTLQLRVQQLSLPLVPQVLMIPDICSCSPYSCRCLRGSGTTRCLGTKTVRSRAGACGAGVTSKPWGMMIVKTQKPAPNHPRKPQLGGRVTSRPPNSP